MDRKFVTDSKTEEVYWKADSRNIDITNTLEHIPFLQECLVLKDDLDENWFITKSKGCRNWWNIYGYDKQ